MPKSQGASSTCVCSCCLIMKGGPRNLDSSGLSTYCHIVGAELLEDFCSHDTMAQWQKQPYRLGASIPRPSAARLTQTTLNTACRALKALASAAGFEGVAPLRLPRGHWLAAALDAEAWKTMLGNASTYNVKDPVRTLLSLHVKQVTLSQTVTSAGPRAFC